MIAAAAVFVLQQSHSALNPAGSEARLIDRLWDAMFLTASVVFVLVVLALLWAAFRQRRTDDAPRSPERERPLKTVVGLATGVTIVVLFGFRSMTSPWAGRLPATPVPTHSRSG